MKRACCSLVALGALMLGVPLSAQVMPVTTSSEAALKLFAQGRELAFHWESLASQQRLRKAVAADSSFVLAYLHLAGTSPPFQRQPYMDRAEAFRDHVSEGEQRLIDAFHAFLLENDPDRAIRILDGLSRDYPDDPYLLGYLGMRHFNRGQYGEAAAFFQRALDRDSTFVAGYNLLGAAAMGARQYEDAARYFREYTRRVPELWMPYYSMGELYLRTGKVTEAGRSFEQAFARDSTGEARNAAGYAYLGTGHPDEAEAVFTEAARRHPEDPSAFDALGELYLESGRFAQAKRQFERALALDPGFLSSRGGLLRASIGEADERFQAAFARHDAEALAALYTPDGQLLPAGSGVVKGASAIRDYWRRAFDAGLTGAKLETVEVFDGADGNSATEVGRYHLMSDGGEADAGKYVVIWQRTPDGWRLHRDIWTTDRAPGQ